MEVSEAVARGGSRGVVSGVTTPQMLPVPLILCSIYYCTAWCAGALTYIAKSIVVSLKQHSR